MLAPTTGPASEPMRVERPGAAETEPFISLVNLKPVEAPADPLQKLHLCGTFIE